MILFTEDISNRIIEEIRNNKDADINKIIDEKVYECLISMSGKSIDHVFHDRRQLEKSFSKGSFAYITGFGSVRGGKNE